MAKWQKTLDKVLSWKSDANGSFDQLCNLLKRLGFEEEVDRSSHHIFDRDDIPEIINLQPGKGGSNAKPYQVKQVRQLVLQRHFGLRYGLAASALTPQ